MDIYNYSLLCAEPSNLYISADITFQKYLFNYILQKTKNKKLYNIKSLF